jgi:hypothetical protein
MSEPRHVVVTLAAIRTLTALEIARANALVGLRQADVQRFLRLLDSPTAPPEEVERGVELLYAWAYQLERREAPATTWEEAQTWRVTVDLAVVDEEADAEATASVQAAVITGLPPDVAGHLTVAQLEEYRAIQDQREAAAKGRRKRRVG